MHNREGCPLVKGSGIVACSIECTMVGPEAACSSVLESDCLRSSCIATVACGRPWRRSPAAGCMPVKLHYDCDEVVTRLNVIIPRASERCKVMEVVQFRRYWQRGPCFMHREEDIPRLTSSKHRSLRISISDHNKLTLSHAKRFIAWENMKDSLIDLAA